MMLVPYVSPVVFLNNTFAGQKASNIRGILNHRQPMFTTPKVPNAEIT